MAGFEKALLLAIRRLLPSDVESLKFIIRASFTGKFYLTAILLILQLLNCLNVYIMKQFKICKKMYNV